MQQTPKAALPHQLLLSQASHKLKKPAACSTVCTFPMGANWSSACFAALNLSSRSKKLVIDISCIAVSVALSLVFIISAFFFLCHRRHIRSFSAPEKGYWKHYGFFTFFAAAGSFAGAIAWAMQLESLKYAADASFDAHSDVEHSVSFNFHSQSYKFGVVFQVLCKKSPPPPLPLTLHLRNLRAPVDAYPI